MSRLSLKSAYVSAPFCPLGPKGVHSFKNIGYDKVLETIEYGNPDTLKAMAAYYIVSERANMYAKTWQEGNVASILYPKADLLSPRISDFLEALGRDEIRRAYFQAHIKWIKENICNDPATLIDSTCLSNDIRINLTQISNHNGDINNKARMITTVQRDSRHPLMFRAVPGNVIDVSTLSRTITLWVNMECRRTCLCWI